MLTVIYARIAPIGWIQIWTQRLHSLYGHYALGSFIPGFYANDMVMTSCMRL